MTAPRQRGNPLPNFEITVDPNARHDTSFMKTMLIVLPEQQKAFLVIQEKATGCDIVIASPMDIKAKTFAEHARVFYKNETWPTAKVPFEHQIVQACIQCVEWYSCTIKEILETGPDHFSDEAIPF